jgi:hypothetical protein
MPAVSFPAQQNKVWPPSATDYGVAASEPLLKAGDVYFNTGTNTYRKCENPAFPATWTDIAIIPGTNFQLTGVSNQSENLIDIERVVGGFLFNGGLYGTITFRMLARFDPGTAGNARLRLYDMGPAGVPIVPVLRSTLSIPFASAGDIVVVSSTLTPSVVPGVNINEIFNTSRMYELRVILDSAGVGDAVLVHWAGIEVS